VGRFDLVVKASFGVLSGIVSWMIGGFGLAFTVLLGLMCIDFTTGMLTAIVNKNLNSAIGTKGLIKKIYIILLIGSVYLIEVSVFKSHGVITDGVSGAFCLIEFVSIVENGGKLGVPIPEKLKEIVLTLKGSPKPEEKK
jgi:toxin secretion/phage lysis holin